MSNLYRQKIVHYVDRGVRRVTSKTPGAKRIEQTSVKWYGLLTMPDGTLPRVPLCTNKTAARAILLEKAANAEKGLAGLVDQFAQHRATPLPKHAAP